MNNKWKEIWNAKGTDCKISLSGKSEFEVYRELKRLDGYDVSIENEEAYYKKFYDSAVIMFEDMKNKMGVCSAYEVGCGSGANLYLLKNRGIEVGGIDYSENLAGVARTVLEEEKLVQIGEAVNLPTDTKYDMVFSDGVFAYFPDEEYGMTVLKKMYDKARKVVVISEVFDKDRQLECEKHRREMIDNYDERYEGLDKVFYKRELFTQFADKHQCTIKFSKVENEYYWNSKYLFHCYLYKA